MKDRIRKVMETQNMTQQEFAEFLHISPASLSSIFTGRTRPTLSIVEAIKKSLPDISTDWLMFGIGQMYNDDVSSADGDSSTPSDPSAASTSPDAESALDFGDAQPGLPDASPYGVPFGGQQGGFGDNRRMVNKIDIPQRSITEIRIFYSDQTWETFVPKK